MKTILALTLSALLGGFLNPAIAEIGIISPAEARKLIEHPDAKARPLVFDTRGGYKDYFRGHLPTAHHLEFDTLRGTDQGVPVQYLPADLTKPLLARAGVDQDRLHLVYATGAELPNDEILSSTMVVHVLEKFGVKTSRSSTAASPSGRSRALTPRKITSATRPASCRSRVIPPSRPPWTRCASMSVSRATS